MNLKAFIDKHGNLTSLILSLIGVIISFITNDSIFFQIIVVILFIVILWQIIRVDALKNKISALEKALVRMNNTIGNITLEVLNRFRNSPERNLSIDFEEITVKVTIDGFDASVESEWKGRCVNQKGVDSYFCEIYGDSNISFSNLKYTFFDLKVDSGQKQGIKNPQVTEFNKMFLVKNRLLKKIKYGESCHFKYICHFPNCMNYGDDYYTMHLPACDSNLKKYEFAIEFIKERPDSVELFDNTEGGDGKYMHALFSDSLVKPFSYKHIEYDVVGIKDFVYIFKRII